MREFIVAIRDVWSGEKHYVSCMMCWFAYDYPMYTVFWCEILVRVSCSISCVFSDYRSVFYYDFPLNQVKYSCGGGFMLVLIFQFFAWILARCTFRFMFRGKVCAQLCLLNSCMKGGCQLEFSIVMTWICAVIFQDSWCIGCFKIHNVGQVLTKSSSQLSWI